MRRKSALAPQAEPVSLHGFLRTPPAASGWASRLSIPMPPNAHPRPRLRVGTPPKRGPQLGDPDIVVTRVVNVVPVFP